MSNEELVEVVQMDDERQRDALAELWSQNRGILSKLCRRYLPETETEDAMQESFFALREAALRFVLGGDVPFLGYLAIWVKSVLLRYRDDLGRVVRIPVYQSARLQRFRRARDDFRKEHGREPGTRELASVTGLTPAEVERLRVLEILATQAASLDKPLTLDGAEEITMGDLLPGSETADEETLEDLSREQVAAALRSWADGIDATRTVTRRYLDGLSLQQISEADGRKLKEVQNTRQKALSSLRKKKREIIPYLPPEYAALAYRGSLQAFRQTGTSATERTVLKILGADD